MTGVFKIRITTKGKKVPQRSVELPQEILADLQRWWYAAKRGDKFEIYCLLEV